MTGAIHAKRFVMIFGILTLFFITGMMSTAVAQLSQEEPEPPMTVPEYVMECYDGKGFAAEPGGVSDLETTLDAAKLLMENPDSWPVGMGQAVDSIVTRYAGMQYLTRGGFVAEGETGPDFRTTAIIIETLDVLGRLDAINVGMVEDYLESSFRGSLTLNKWLTEGDFYTKYWALRTAHTLDCVHLLGLHDVNLRKVIAPDANRADFPEVEPYLVWGQPLFEQDSRYGSVFKEMDYEKQLAVVESLDMIIGNSTLNPTLMPMLVDVDSFTAKVSQRFDKKSGFFLNEAGDADLEVTRKAVRALNRTGTLQHLFADGMGVRRLVKNRKNLDILMDAWTIDGMSEVAKTTDLVDMKEIKAGLENVGKPLHVFTPQFDDVDVEGDTGIASWDEDGIQKVYVPDALIESLNSEGNLKASRDDDIGSIIVLATLISLTVVTVGAGKKKLAIILSLLCVALFMGQYAYGIGVVTRDAARFLGSMTHNSKDKDLITNTGMLSIGTLWTELAFATNKESPQRADEASPEFVDPSTTTAGFSSRFGGLLDTIRSFEFGSLRTALAEHVPDSSVLSIDFPDFSFTGTIKEGLHDYASALCRQSGLNGVVGTIKKIPHLVKSWLQKGTLRNMKEAAAAVDWILEKGIINLDEGDEIAHIAVKLDENNEFVKDDDISKLVVAIDHAENVENLKNGIETVETAENVVDKIGPNYEVFVFQPKEGVEKVTKTLEDLKQLEKDSGKAVDADLISLQGQNLEERAAELKAFENMDTVSRMLQVRDAMEPSSEGVTAPFAMNNVIFAEDGNRVEIRRTESQDFMNNIDHTGEMFTGPYGTKGEVTALQLAGMVFYKEYADTWDFKGGRGLNNILEDNGWTPSERASLGAVLGMIKWENTPAHKHHSLQFGDKNLAKELYDIFEAQGVDMARVKAQLPQVIDKLHYSMAYAKKIC